MKKTLTLMQCKLAAARFATFEDWVKYGNESYVIAMDKGWVIKCVDSIASNKQIKWSLDTCLLSARKHNTTRAWIACAPNAYAGASRGGFLEECLAHMVPLELIWTREKCIEDAKQYSSISMWQKKQTDAVFMAAKHNWINDCVGHMKNVIRMTAQRCKTSAERYSSIDKWKREDCIAYYYAKHHRHLRKYRAYFKSLNHIPKRGNVISREACISSAAAFNKLITWRQTYDSHYQKALRMGWLGQCTSHFEEPSNAEVHFLLKDNLLPDVV